MDRWSGMVLLQIPALAAIAATVAGLALWYHEGALSRMAGGRLSQGARACCVVVAAGAWLVLTAASWWCLVDWALLAVIVAYALFGPNGGWTALGASGVVFAVVPVIWGGVLVRLVRREFRYAAFAEAMRPLPVVKRPLRGIPG